MTTLAPEKTYDRTTEDLGNIVELGHVNIWGNDQLKAMRFYCAGLGLTRDPILPVELDVIWFNVGRGQIHCPTRNPSHVLRGTIGLIVPDLDAVERRLEAVTKRLEGTEFAFERRGSHIDVRCPWGNRLRVHAPDFKRFGPIVLGLPYVEFDVPRGAAEGIERFYREIFGALTGMEAGERGARARIDVGNWNAFYFRETERELPPYDGHHVQITTVDFSGPHKRLLERGLITQESDEHQYRFKDLVDPKSGKVLFTIEHEVRSLRHPLYGRPIFNRNSQQVIDEYVPGRDGGVF